MNELLPIGTIFKVKESDIVLFMLIGYYPRLQESENVFDYLAVLYPYGIDGDESFYTINSDQIEERSLIIKWPTKGIPKLLFLQESL